MSIYATTIFFLVLFLFISCQPAEENRIPINLDNDTICDISSKKNACPKGNFILMDIPSSFPNEDLWVHAFLRKGTKPIYSETYLTNKPSKHVTHNAVKLTRLKYLFDNLSLGTYVMNYVSVFQDTIVQKFDFKENVEMYFPSRLSRFYKRVEARDLDFNTLKNGDVLQLAYQEVSCFPTDSDRLYEFMYEKDSVFINRENDWESLSAKVFNKHLTELVQVLDANTNQDCSTIGTYTFKKKNSDKVYQVIDGSCEIDGLKILKL